MSTPPAIDVLLVEDNPHDAELTIRTLERAKLRNRVHRVASGDEALAFLRQEGQHRDAPRPDLILLDLNLPGMDGRDVLTAVKSDDRWWHIPVIVVTTSQAEEDVARSYAQHANAFVQKPIDAAAFIRAVDSIEQFWLQIVKLP